MPEFHECLAAEERGEKEAVGFERHADLDQGADEIVDPVKGEVADDGIERGRNEGQALLVDSEVTGEDRREIRLDENVRLALAGKSLVEGAVTGAEFEGDGKASGDVIEAVCEPARDVAEEEVRLPVPGGRSAVPPDHAAIEGTLGHGNHGDGQGGVAQPGAGLLWSGRGSLTRIAMAEVVIYTTMFCPYCSGARKLLDSLGIAFEEIDVTMNAAERASMALRAGGRRTVPQIFIDGEAIGGYDDLAQLERSGGLAAILGDRT